MVTVPLAAEHRLVLPAAATWIAATVLVGTPAAAVGVAIGASTLALLCTAVLARQDTAGLEARHVRRPRRRRGARWASWATGWTGLLAVTFLGIALAASVLTIRDASRSPPLLTDAIESGRAVAVTLTVTDKTELLSRTPSTPWNRSTGSGEQRVVEQRIRGTVTELTVGGQTASVSVPVVVFAEARSTRLASIGERISLTGQARWTEPGEQAAALIFAGRVTTVAEPPAWLAWAPGMRAALVEQARDLPGRGGELVPGLATGDTSAVSDELDTAMMASSLSHLTAVSGDIVVE